MVEVLATTLGQNTTRVKLEVGLVSLDGNRDRRDIQSSLQLVNRVVLDIGPRRDGSLGFGLVEAAISLDSSVWIVGLGLEWELFGIVKRLGHQTALAAVSLEITTAVEELLLREGFQDSILEEVRAFNGTGGGEGPARSAMCLILDFSDGSLGSPVDLIGHG